MRATNLTRQLLTFTKGGEPITKPVKIEDLIQENTSFVLRGSKVSCEMHIPDDLPLVEVDPNQIGQLLHNIILNAKQAMSEIGILTIEVEIVEVMSPSNLPLDDGKYLKISIIDTGKGISDEIRSKVFDPYFTTKGSGTGLGLATSFSIVKRHKGYIDFISEPEKGTSFYIYLPVSSAEYKDEPIEDTLVQFSGQSVLIMDDDAHICSTVSGMLGHLGLVVTTSMDANAAYEAFKKRFEENNPYDLVILDLTIPGGIGGKELIPKLRDLVPDLKAIVASGYSTDPILANYQQHGFDGVLPKPFSLSQLKSAVSGLLSPD